ncbi:MAG: hypothetical protein LBT05_13925, partial [Planctomycetaceae bacterium]|nr:hypothetical protein [Planctomycetaceae bacterium]
IIIEGKTLLENAVKSDHSTVHLQKGYGWTGEGQIFFKPDTETGGSLECRFPVEKEELRQLTLRMTEANDYGIYRILLDGKTVREYVDFYGKSVKTRELNLGQLVLKPGIYTIRFECLGKRSESRGNDLGIDSVRLRERWNVKRIAPPDVQVR